MRRKSRMARDVFQSKGEKSRAVAYAIVAIFGAGIGYLVAVHLSQGALLREGLAPYDLWMIFAGSIGSMAGLYIAGSWFGHRGWNGLIKALAASVWVSFVGSLIGGTLMLPLYGTMFGPFTLAVTLSTRPIFAILWFANLFGAHLMLTYWQRERDSIFEAFDDGRVEAFRNGRDLQSGR